MALQNSVFIVVFFFVFLEQSFSQIIPQVTNASHTYSSDGSIILSVQGGVAPYSYQWDSGTSTSNELLNLMPGSYCVTVTDLTGCCVMSQCFTVGFTCPDLMEGLHYISVCLGNDGSLEVLLKNDGTPPYTFNWNTGATTQSITNLSPAKYCVTVSDNAGCTRSFCYTLKNKISLSANIANACAGQANGAINLNVSTGIPPYNYFWSNGATSEDISNLSIGSYCVTVTDFSGCISTKCFAVENKLKLTAQIYNDCMYAPPRGNGKINLTIIGAISPTFHWSNGASTEDIDGLATGQYCVTVTSQDGCTNSACYQVSNFATTAAVDKACIGQNNGAIDVTPVGGISPFTYSWSNGAFTEDIKNIAGNVFYYYTITDSRGCSLRSGESVQEEPYESYLVKNSCISSASGSIWVGNVPGYTYLWSNGSTSSYLTGLSVGSYCVTITTPKGCISSKCFQVGTGLSSTGIYANTIRNVSSCYGVGTSAWNACDGAININIDNTTIAGDGPFTFNWSGPGGFTSSGANISNLCVGHYTVTVSNAQGCSGSKSFDICCCDDTSVSGTFSPLCLSSSVTINNQNTIVDAPKPENNFKGSINLVVSYSPFGQGYYYNWSGPNGFTAHTEDIDNLSAGVYCVTVTDGCNSATKCFDLGFCDPDHTVKVSVPFTPSCEGGHSGQITINLNQGALPYSLSWNGGNATNLTQPYTIRGLEEGIYTVTVTDAKYCSTTNTVSIVTAVGGGYVFPLNKFLSPFDPVDECFDQWTVNARIEINTEPCYSISSNNLPSSGYPYSLGIEWPSGSYSTLMVGQDGNCEVVGPSTYDVHDDDLYTCALFDQYGCRKEWCFEFGDQTNLTYPSLNTVVPLGGDGDPFTALTGCIKCENCGLLDCAGTGASHCDTETFEKFEYVANYLTNPCGGGGHLQIPCNDATIVLPPSAGIEYIDWASGQGVANGICEYNIGCLFLGLDDLFFQGDPVYVETKIRIPNSNCQRPVQTDGNPFVICLEGVTYTFSDEQDCWAKITCRGSDVVVFEGILEEFTKICYRENSDHSFDKVLLCTLVEPNAVLDVLDSDVEAPVDCRELCIPCQAAIGLDPRSVQESPTLEYVTDIGINTYPNPFDQILVVEFNSLNEQGTVQILITDMVGRVMLKSTSAINFGTNRFTVHNGEDFVPGIYYVFLKDSEGHISTSKVIRMAK